MRKVKYIPQQDYIQVELDVFKDEVTLSSGLVYATNLGNLDRDQTEKDRFKKDTGTVVSMGPECFVALGPDHSVKPGDKIKFKTYGGLEMHVRDESGMCLDDLPSMRLIRAQDVICKIELIEE